MYCEYDDNGIVCGYAPEQYDAGISTAFMDEYLALVNNHQGRMKIMIDISRVTHIPDSDAKRVLFEKIRQIRKPQEGDKVAYVVKNKFIRYAMESILMVTRTESYDRRWFTSVEEAKAWLKSSG